MVTRESEQMVIIKEYLKTFYSREDAVRLDINNAIDVLSNNGGFSKEEEIVITAMREQFSVKDIANLIGMDVSELDKSPNKVYRIYDRACAKLADALGPDYQDSKILKRVESRLKRPLTKEEEYFCIKKMTDFRLRGNNNITIYNFKIVGDGQIVRGKDRRYK